MISCNFGALDVEDVDVRVLANEMAPSAIALQLLCARCLIQTRLIDGSESTSCGMLTSILT